MTRNDFTNNNGQEVEQQADEKPDNFHMKIHSGMLETMGHNMYSSVAKCLAEFVANSYDADAENVNIEMDFFKIDEAKKAVRANARQEKKQNKRNDISAIYDPLPSDITIKISDDGHGMTAHEIQNYFLAITRNRREDGKGGITNIYTESGKRKVMGRKGVGKLAGFGAAGHIKVESKCAGQTYSTSFEMDYDEIKNNTELAAAKFKANYAEGLEKDSHFTIITLSKLRCDSMKPTQETINNTLSRTFHILDGNFKIHINNQLIHEIDIDWEFTYAPKTADGSMATETVKIDEEDPDSQFPIQYIVRFRGRPNDHDADEPTRKKRSSLPAERRGARIYSHGRLTHGPSLLNLHSGVHNFHAQDYMECIVVADAIDEFEHDFIVTSREGLNKDNPVVNALFNKVTDIMKLALAEHYKHRDKLIDDAIEKDEFSKGIMSPLSNVNKKSQKAAKQILKVIGKEHGIKSQTYKEMAPIMLQAVNAGEVLTRLIELEHDPKSIPVLAHSMLELTRMERSDLLKLYRGRQNAISALQKLYEDGLASRKGKGFEKELHSLLKENPWLVNPEYSNFLTSDRPMGDVCRDLNNTLQIDDHSPEDGDKTRPDLVYVATNSIGCEHVIIVELKSPGIEMEIEHLSQLERYIRKVSEHLATKFGNQKKVKVTGYLIGKIPPSDTKADPKRDLIDKIAKFGPNDNIMVKDMLELVTSTKTIHIAGIEALETEEKLLAEELS